MSAQAAPELPSRYEPEAIEARLFAQWSDGGYFGRGAAGFARAGLPPYTIVIPPPNVTGMLHMGHALNNTLQDILTRRARMQGRPTLWIVGTDHAGIATQNKVEQKLAAEGKTRFDLGREAFVEACWDWRREYGSTIIEQLKAMGCSCDYNNEQFTMDGPYAEAIRKVFVDWYKAGLVYRGLRIINWCPRCTTALADDEVEHADEQGKLWHLRYPLVEPVGDCSYLVVATTRPETMLGDTGVAVNPADERYAALLAAGAKVRLPLTGRVIPVFADDYVDKDFGTGAVKVTPAHDPNDFAMGERHGLEQINIFDEKAVVNANGGKYEGKGRYEAREAVLADLEELGLLHSIEEHDHAVGHCYRCDTTIEPWASEQWFVSMRPLAEPAIAAVRDGRVTFHPKRWENVYFQWMENIRDWCISRQLWWGHRIPVFYCDACGWQDASEQDVGACPVCGADVRQDEDVLDTWFSSQLWPFATAGWPGAEAQSALASYYPTQVLSTARDIIFLWVARMVMSSMYFMSSAVPFNDVIIHPTVLDKHGNIMSKSRGNGIDPMELISEYGADAMRFGLAMQVTGAQDMKFDREKLAVYRNFATKIWNASRFVLMNLGDYDSSLVSSGQPMPATDADRWILSRLARLASQLGDEAEQYDFGSAARALYRFFWNEFCDWYIEFAKGQLASEATRASTQQILVSVLDNALRYLHPYMPFITDEIWQHVPHGSKAPSLIVAPYPEAAELAVHLDASAEASIEQVCAIIAAVRSARARYGISPKQQLSVAVRLAAAEPSPAAQEGMALLVKTLANASLSILAPDEQLPPSSSVTISQAAEVAVRLEGVVDLDAERNRLRKEREKAEANLQKLQKKLSNEGFLAKAAAEVVEKAKSEAADLAAAIEQLDAQLSQLS